MSNLIDEIGQIENGMSKSVGVGRTSDRMQNDANVVGKAETELDNTFVGEKLARKRFC